MSRFNSRIKRIEKGLGVDTVVLICPTLNAYLEARAENPANLVLMNFFRSNDEAESYRSKWRRDVFGLKRRFKNRGLEFTKETEEMLLNGCKN